MQQRWKEIYASPYDPLNKRTSSAQEVAEEAKKIAEAQANDINAFQTMGVEAAEEAGKKAGEDSGREAGAVAGEKASSMFNTTII